MMRLAIRFLALLVTAYIGVCGFLYLSQDALLYHPTPAAATAAGAAITFEHDGETLRGWQSGGGKPAVLYFGGNAEDVSRSAERFARLLPGRSVFLPHYRGYGGSSGEPSQDALFADALHVYDRVSEAHGPVSVIGRSLGSGVAVYVAARRKVERLVLVTPYDSVANVAQAAYPFVPVPLLLRDTYPSVDYVPEVDAPTLVLMADRDEVVPHGSTLALVRRFPPSQVRVQTIANTNHVTISRSAAYDEAIRSFLDAPAAAPADTAARAMPGRATGEP